MAFLPELGHTQLIIIHTHIVTTARYPHNIQIYTIYIHMRKLKGKKGSKVDVDGIKVCFVLTFHGCKHCVVWGSFLVILFISLHFYVSLRFASWNKNRFRERAFINKKKYHE